jgi:hypothetical protein
MQTGRTKFWRFPGNRYTRESGLDTPDMETFMKDPIASLAREICQNSVDAKLKNDSPARIDFKVFELDIHDLPDKDTLLAQFHFALQNWENKNSPNQKLINRLKLMREELKKPKITCLRISDFNTTGLIGVGDNESSKPFYMLTKGSGVSFKGGTSGGSKGIGKYATFVASKVHTIFYSTVTVENENGHLGIAKLCSANILNSDEKTLGEGYYGLHEQNMPIEGILNLDPNFERNDNETGTDIYIIGYNDEDWVETVIAKILESFMVAIFRGNLEVIVQDKIIDKKTLHDIVWSNIYQNVSRKIENQIKSQYILLTDEDVYIERIHLEGYGVVELRLKAFKNEKSQFATKACSFVRYPYMKIKDINKISHIPSAALAIIEDNKINEIFRNFENPQHTNWDFKRNDYSKQERKEASDLFKELKEQIMDIIYLQLSSGSSTSTDFDGASEYLPDSDEGDFGEQDSVQLEEKPTLSKIKRRKTKKETGFDNDPDAESVQPDLGEIDPEGSEVSVPEGQNSGDDGSTHSGNDDTGAVDDGDTEVYKTIKLEGIKYRLIAIDPKNGKYAIKFSYVEDEKKCDLEIRPLDDSGKMFPVTIESALVNGKSAQTKNNAIKHFEIKAGHNNEVIIVTDQTELFSGDVRLYAYR